MRMPRHTAFALALVALVSLAAAGCGGGGDELTESTAATTTEAPPRLTKAELIEQGDAICAEANAAVGALGSGETETSATSTQVPALYVGMVEDIEELGMPVESQGYPEFSEAAEELAKVEGEAKLAAEREDSVALAEAETEGAAALEQFQTRAEAYGFEKCGEGPSAPTPGAGGGTAGGEPGEAVEEGGVEAEAEVESEPAEPEYVEPEVEVPAPETGGAGGAPEEAAPEGGGTGAGGGGGGESGVSSGGVGPG